MACDRFKNEQYDVSYDFYLELTLNKSFISYGLHLFFT